MGNYHDWSETEFDWKGLYEAEVLLNKICKIFRIGLSSKEKYGTIRTSIRLFDGSLHSLTHPGYSYSQYPNWLWRLQLDVQFKIMLNFPFKYLVTAIQLFQLNVGYRLAYYIAMMKYPHIAEEICVDADYPEYVIGGQEIHDRYWETMK